MRSKPLTAHLFSLPRGPSSGPAKSTGAGKGKEPKPTKAKTKPWSFFRLNGGTGKAHDAPKAKEVDLGLARRKGALAERERCASIFASAAAELAFNTDLTPEQAIAVLGTLPAQRKAGASLAERMARLNIPNPGGGDPERPNDEATAAMIIAVADKARGTDG